MSPASIARDTLLKSWARPDWLGDLACWAIALRMPKHVPSALGIGLPRSGTHTIAECWQDGVAAHESWDSALIQLLTQYKQGKISKRRLQRRLLCRWRLTARVKFDVFHALHHFLDVLPNGQQPTHYVLTVRDPIRWLESMMNQSYLTRDMPQWMELEDYNFGRYQLPREPWDTEQLSQYVRWPVRAYFKYWNDHVKRVLSLVEPNQLIIGQPNMMPEFLVDIAEFCGFDPALLKRNHHGGKGNRKIPSSALPESEILQRLVSEECSTATILLGELGISFEATTITKQ